MTTETDVLIVGAGSAGLSAAKEFLRLGVACSVIEASHRIGGRAYSEELLPDVWFDLGCAWLTDGDANPFAMIADDLGIALGRDAAYAYKPENHRFIRNGTALTQEQRVACHRYYTESYKVISM